jgi:hypothetical protein
MATVVVVGVVEAAVPPPQAEAVNTKAISATQKFFIMLLLLPSKVFVHLLSCPPNFLSPCHLPRFQMLVGLKHLAGNGAITLHGYLWGIIAWF